MRASSDEFNFSGCVLKRADRREPFEQMPKTCLVPVFLCMLK